jgi:hypothetical protein
VDRTVVSRIFMLGGGAKPESLSRAPKVRSRGKLDALGGVFPPSQKLKVMIPTKCTFWVNFEGKILCSDKKATI